MSEHDVFTEELMRAMKVLPISLSEEQAEKFYVFYNDLIETNKVMNLTAITEMKEVISKHFVDSLSLVLAVPDLSEKPYTVMDLGTGAGFPGIPLAIAFPNLRLTLLDSLNKRIRFIGSVCEKLEIGNITAIHGRAEDYARNHDYREQFDLCVSRAVANLSTLSEYCLPFIHKNGLFIPYKSEKAEEEIHNAEKALSLLSGKLEKTVPFELPDEEGVRNLLVIRKTGYIHNRYPRKAGLPSKEPL